MRVILLSSVQKVGKKGDVVDVSDGYAENALFPRKLAILATPKNLEALQKKEDALKQSRALSHELLEKAIASLPDEALTLSVRANEKGHLFSKIHTEDIVKELEKHRIVISPSNIVLTKEIKQLGKYSVLLKEGSFSKNLTLIVQSK